MGVLLLLTVLALVLSRAPNLPTWKTLVARWAPPPSDFIDLVQGQLVHLRDEGPKQ